MQTAHDEYTDRLKRAQLGRLERGITNLLEMIAECEKVGISSGASFEDGGFLSDAKHPLSRLRRASGDLRDRLSPSRRHAS